MTDDHYVPEIDHYIAAISPGEQLYPSGIKFDNFVVNIKDKYVEFDIWISVDEKWPVEELSMFASRKKISFDDLVNNSIFSDE